MQGIIESISTNREGATVVRFVVTNTDVSELRLGLAELIQLKYEQMTFEEE